MRLVASCTPTLAVTMVDWGEEGTTAVAAGNAANFPVSIEVAVDSAAGAIPDMLA